MQPCIQQFILDMFVPTIQIDLDLKSNNDSYCTLFVRAKINLQNRPKMQMTNHG